MRVAATVAAASMVIGHTGVGVAFRRYSFDMVTKTAASNLS